jgi:hypothetical protein
MKKTTLILSILLFTAICANSQITKGNWMVGGSGNYTNETVTSDTGTKTKYTIITIKPNVGYFIMDKFAVGGTLNYMHQGSFNTYGIGLFSRYYFLEPEKIFNLYAQIHYDYDINVSDVSFTSRTRNTQFYGARMGMEVFFNNSVGLEFSLQYEKGVLNNANSDTFKTIIGFQIYLEKK